MIERFVIFDPASARAVLSGKKDQLRCLTSSVLSGCKPGDRIWVKEACVGARIVGHGMREVQSSAKLAELVVFPDGWRQDRSGRGRAGRPPNNRKLEWIPAIHMPRWACRLSLKVEWLRVERLQDISRHDVQAEGVVPVLGGLLWRWHKPVRRTWINPSLAFAAVWDATHGTGGERWEDNPVITIIGFSAERHAVDRTNEGGLSLAELRAGAAPSFGG